MQTFAQKIDKLVYDDIEIIKLNNYLYVGNKEDNDIIYVPGKSFIFYYNDYYYSFIHEMVGQYEVIKKYIPDIVPYFFGQEEFPKNASMLPHIKSANLYFIDIHKMYAENDIFYHKTHNILFEETYMIMDLEKIVSNNIFENSAIYPYWIRPHFDDTKSYTDNNSWQLKGLELIRDKILPNLYLNSNSPKKLYISRKDANLRHIASNDEFWREKRYYQYEPNVELYFFDRDYVGVTFEGMPLLTQMQLIYNATHIAGISGGGFVNLLAASSKAKIISVQPKKDFKISYQYMANLFDLDYNEINVSHVAYEPEKVMKELDKYSHLY